MVRKVIPPTEGDWKQCPVDASVVLAANGDVVAFVAECGPQSDTLRAANANAKLIAAVPQLQRALQDCEARLALLVKSGRSKLLDAVAAENARKALKAAILYEEE